MELRTKGLHALADVEHGLHRVSAPHLADTHLGPLGAGAVFTFANRRRELAKPKPDAVVAEDGVIEATWVWRGDVLSDRVVLRVRWRLDPDDGGDGALLIEARLTNETSQPIELEAIDPLLVRADDGGELQLGHAPADWRLLRHGWQSWSATRAYRAEERDAPPVFKWLAEMEENGENLSPNKRGVFVGEQVFFMRNAGSSQALALGFLTSARAFGDFRLELPSRQQHPRLLRARCRFDGVPVAPGETVAAETLWLRFGGRADDPLAAWAARSGRAMAARTPAKAPVGWCSWYYFYTKVTQAAFLANLERMASLRDELGIEVFQLDDGYQSAIGDWLTTNEKFPDGLAALPKAVEAAGFMPGLWTAPFLVDRTSRLAQEHPDWLLRRANGKPVRGVYNPVWSLWRGMWTLDVTHPEVLAWLTETFAALRAMGWRFLKIDFLYAAALPGVRHDPTLTRAGALRAGLEAVRRGAGEDALLLGCGCPLGPAVGICDIMRIGPDVTPRWRNPMRWALRDRNCLSTLHAVRNTIHRGFLHRAWWINDPDCVMARAKKNKLTLPEIQTFASLAAVSGGMFLLSDDMTEYPPERLELVKSALAHRGAEMRPLDFDAGEFPTRLVARATDGWLLQVINYGRRAISPVLDLKEFLSPDDLAKVEEIVDVWQKRPVLQQDGLMRVGPIPAHGSALLRIRRNDAGTLHV